MAMRNLTLTLPADLVRRAKIIAATRETSISALVAEYLEALAHEEDDYDREWRDERRLMSDGLPMRVGAVTWTRADAHER